LLGDNPELESGKSSSLISCIVQCYNCGNRLAAEPCRETYWVEAAGAFARRYKIRQVLESVTRGRGVVKSGSEAYSDQRQHPAGACNSIPIVSGDINLAGIWMPGAAMSVGIAARHETSA